MKGRAFSSEVDTGSRQENASNQESRAPFRFHRNGKGSRSGEIEAGAGSAMDRLKLVKMLCGIGFLLVLASNIWTISRWSESRGVYDDVCYLRQAHLFQQFGLDGLN